MSAIELSTRKDDQPKCSGVMYTQHWHPPDAFSESRERPRLTPPDFELDDGSGFESTLRRGHDQLKIHKARRTSAPLLDLLRHSHEGIFYSV